MKIEIPDYLNEEWDYSPKNTSLPKEVVLFCWHLGISGEKIYIPARGSKLKAATLKLLAAIERAYMEDGCTFFLERNARSLFSHRFGAKKAQEICRVSTKTALKASRRAYSRWRYWFKEKEEPRLKELMVIAATKRISYNELSFYYKKTRQWLKDYQPVTAEYYSHKNIFPMEVAENMISLARESARDCSWNMETVGNQNAILQGIGDPIAYYPGLAKMTGSVNASIFLCHLLSWEERQQNEAEWILKTIEEIHEETGLTHDQQDAAIKTLKQMGILEVEVRGLPARRYFRLNKDMLKQMASGKEKIMMEN